MVETFEVGKEYRLIADPTFLAVALTPTEGRTRENAAVVFGEGERWESVDETRKRMSEPRGGPATATGEQVDALKEQLVAVGKATDEAVRKLDRGKADTQALGALDNRVAALEKGSKGFVSQADFNALEKRLKELEKPSTK